MYIKHHKTIQKGNFREAQPLWTWLHDTMPGNPLAIPHSIARPTNCQGFPSSKTEPTGPAAPLGTANYCAMVSTCFNAPENQSCQSWITRGFRNRKGVPVYQPEIWIIILYSTHLIYHHVRAWHRPLNCPCQTCSPPGRCKAGHFGCGKPANQNETPWQRWYAIRMYAGISTK